MPIALLRPRDTDALRAELRRVATERGVPVLFGGEVHGDTLLLSEFVGTRTGALRGLAVRSSRGPRRGHHGGRQAALGAPTTATRRPSPTTTTARCCPRASGRSWRCRWSSTAGPAGDALRRLPRRAPIGGRTADLDGGLRAPTRPTSCAVRDEVDRRLRLREAQLANFGDSVAEPSRSARCTPNCAASPPTRRPPMRPSFATWPDVLAGAGDRPDSATVDGRASSTCWPRSPWAAPMPKPPNVFR